SWVVASAVRAIGVNESSTQVLVFCGKDRPVFRNFAIKDQGGVAIDVPLPEGFSSGLLASGLKRLALAQGKTLSYGLRTDAPAKWVKIDNPDKKTITALTFAPRGDLVAWGSAGSGPLRLLDLAQANGKLISVGELGSTARV